MKERNTIYNLNSEVDYRETLMLAEFNEKYDAEDLIDTYYSSKNQDEDEAFDAMFLKYTGNKAAKEIEVEVIPGRNIKVSGHGKIGRFDFRSLIDSNYGSSDFIAICNHFHVVFLENIPTIDVSNKNLARRFILFVF